MFHRCIGQFLSEPTENRRAMAHMSASGGFMQAQVRRPRKCTMYRCLCSRRPKKVQKTGVIFCFATVTDFECFPYACLDRYPFLPTQPLKLTDSSSTIRIFTELSQKLPSSLWLPEKNFFTMASPIRFRTSKSFGSLSPMSSTSANGAIKSCSISSSHAYRVLTFATLRSAAAYIATASLQLRSTLHSRAHSMPAQSSIAVAHCAFEKQAMMLLVCCSSNAGSRTDVLADADEVKFADDRLEADLLCLRNCSVKSRNSIPDKAA
jgi:hypothetical protein